MPRIVATVDHLQQYLGEVMRRADHHAKSVADVCLAVLGAVVWRKNGDLEVYERNGHITNVLWLRVNSKRYALSYNPDDQTIDLRAGTVRRGNTLYKFDNATSASYIKHVFASL